MQRLRFSAGVATALFASSLLVGATTSPATAAENGAAVAANKIVPAFGVVTQRKVVNKTSSRNFIDYSQQLAYCNVQTNGLSCSINRTAQAGRTIQLGLGISRGTVATQLGISASETQAVGVVCNSGAMKKGQNMVAYAVGTRHKYKVNKMTARSGVILSNETSNWLYAFDPYPAGISCKVI